MSDKDRLRFTGEGFSDDELSKEELKQHRERAHFIDRHFLSVESFLEQTGLRWISQIGKAAPAFLKMAGFITAVGGAIVVLTQWGFFQ